MKYGSTYLVERMDRGYAKLGKAHHYAFFGLFRDDDNNGNNITKISY